jgi:hypothetical protein
VFWGIIKYVSIESRDIPDVLFERLITAHLLRFASTPNMFADLFLALLETLPFSADWVGLRSVRRTRQQRTQQRPDFGQSRDRPQSRE